LTPVEVVYENLPMRDSVDLLFQLPCRFTIWDAVPHNESLLLAVELSLLKELLNDVRVISRFLVHDVVMRWRSASSRHFTGEGDRRLGTGKGVDPQTSPPRLVTIELNIGDTEYPETPGEVRRRFL
jgi:hypothetical protein